MEKRIEELKEQEARLQMQLDEVRYLLQGYMNTLKAQQEQAEKEQADSE